MKELEDLSWFPHFLRTYQTDYIGFLTSQFRVYKTLEHYIHQLPVKGQPLIDLCSGSGRPAICLFNTTKRFSGLTLTDKFPSKFADSKLINYVRESSDVLGMEFRKEACYTMFNAFHHFTDNEKIKITEKLRAVGSKGFIVEILEPDILSFLKVLTLTTLGCLLLTPFIKPFSIQRLFYTYILPLNILAISYDGLVSVIKSRSLNEYHRFFSEEDNIKVFRLKSFMGSLVVIEIN